MTETIKQQQAQFIARKNAAARQAAQYIALQLICGLDLPTVLSATAAQKQQIALKLNRLIERERLKGLNCHWSYDLNRHIALKQVFNLISQ